MMARCPHLMDVPLDFTTRMGRGCCLWLHPPMTRTAEPAEAGGYVVLRKPLEPAQPHAVLSTKLGGIATCRQEFRLRH